MPTLGAQVVRTLSDHAQSVVDLCPIHSATLFGTRSSRQLAMQQTQHALVVQASDRHHFIQQSTTFFALRTFISSPHDAKILPAFVDVHLV